MTCSSINHAVKLTMHANCPGCGKHYCDLILEKKELLILRCGHIFDQACMLKMSRERASCRVCKGNLKKVEPLAKNLYGCCPIKNGKHTSCSRSDDSSLFKKEIEASKRPHLIQDSLSFDMQILITNCGHLVHASCYMELDELICPDCNQTIKILSRFPLKAIAYDRWREKETDPIIDEFLPDNQKEKNAAAKALEDNDMLDGFEIL